MNNFSNIHNIHQNQPAIVVGGSKGIDRFPYKDFNGVVISIRPVNRNVPLIVLLLRHIKICFRSLGRHKLGLNSSSLLTGYQQRILLRFAFAQEPQKLALSQIH